MDAITTRQNSTQNLVILRSRRRLYLTAKRYQGALVLLTLALPIISLSVAAFVPWAKAYVAAFALLFGICDVIFFDRWLKGLLRSAARLQEAFDCDVLDIQRNNFLTGNAVDPEEIYELASKTTSSGQDHQLRDWYPVETGAVPTHVGRILCQRQNLIYDNKVRKSYGRLLSIGLIVLLTGLLIYSIATQITVDALIVTVLAPATPILNWILREYFRQQDTITTLAHLKAESEKLWKHALNGMTTQEAAARSRELQDAIYNHRVASPIVFDFIYYWHRNGLEAQMNAGAVHLVAEFQQVRPTHP
jgi:SMODS-associating 4TM effector domain